MFKSARERGGSEAKKSAGALLKEVYEKWAPQEKARVDSEYPDTGSAFRRADLHDAHANAYGKAANYLAEFGENLTEAGKLIRAGFNSDGVIVPKTLDRWQNLTPQQMVKQGDNQEGGQAGAEARQYAALKANQAEIDAKIKETGGEY